jgi:hypothetical protein
MVARKTTKKEEPSWGQIGNAIGTKIEKEFKDEDFKCCKMKGNVNVDGTSGAIYGLGFIGALIYYISTATSFWMGLLGVLKAIVWPAFLVFELLRFMGA